MPTPVAGARSESPFVFPLRGTAWVAPFLLTLGGLALRLAVWPSHVVPAADGLVHAGLARALHGGPPLEAVPPPGYALFIWAVEWFTDGLTAARAVSLTAGTAAIPLAWLLARALGAGAWAAFPALAVAVLPGFVAGSVTTRSEPLFLALLLGALLLARRRRDVLGGVLMGAAFLVQPGAILAAAATAGLLRSKARARRWLEGWGLVALPALLAVGIVAGQWGWSDRWFPLGGRRWWTEGGSVGLWLLPVWGVFLVLVAAAIPRLPSRAGRLVLGVLALAAVLGMGVRERATYRGAKPPPEYVEVAKAGQWLKTWARPGARVFSVEPVAAYAGGGEYHPIPLGDYEGILDTIVREKGDFLIVDSEKLKALGSALLPLSVDKPVAWHELRVKPVYVRIRGDDLNTLVYRVIRPGGPAPLAGEENMKEAVGHMNHSEDHFFHGILAMRAERWWIAAGEFEYTVRADELNAEAHNNIAQCLLKDGRDLARADEHAHTAVYIEPQNPRYLATLIEALHRVGKEEESKQMEARLAGLSAKAAPGP